MADDAQRAPYEPPGRGWMALVMQRDYPQALQQFMGENPLPVGQQRVHGELAIAYRQAALLAARATIQVYDVARREEDPDQVDCLVGISKLLLADDQASQLLDACVAGQYGGEHGELSLQAKAWREWQAARPWPPAEPLALTPGSPSLAEPAQPGVLPDAGSLPHYRFKDKVEGLEIQAANPATLLGLALFHERAALATMPAGAGALNALLQPWRLPLEPGSADLGPLEEGLLFGSTMLSSEDASFLAALASDQGIDAIAAHPASPLAIAIEPCVDAKKGAVDEACALERATRCFEQLRGAMEITSGGEAGFHRPFADLGRVGIVRAAAAAAQAVGDERAMGLLRLNAADFSTGPGAEPHYLLSLAAWDAGNRNSSRAGEFLHAQIGHLPGIEVARFPLDALHVRLSRESAPGIPMH